MAAFRASPPASWLSVMQAFVEAIDDVPDDAAVAAVVDFLSKLGINSQQSLAGLKTDELGVLPTNLVHLGLLKRTVLAASIAYKSKQQGLSPVQGGAPSQPSQGSGDAQGVSSQLMSQQLALAGNEISAKAMAEACAPSAKTPIVALKDVGIVIPHKLMAEAALFTLLDSERRLAAKEGRKAFIYVDLTAKEILPPWVLADQVGGRTVMSGEVLTLAQDANTTSLAALGHALRAASTSPRFFRHITQWMGSWTRYWPLAVAATHLTVSEVIAYQSTIVKLAEEQRVKYGNSFLAFLYDEVHRRSIGQRIRSGEQLDFMEEFAKINDDAMDIAKSRLASTIATLKLQEAPGAARVGTGESSRGAVAQANAESALAKQSAAAEALAKKAQSAVKDLARQQDVIDRRNLDQLGGHSDQGKGQGKGRGKSGGKRTKPPSEEQEAPISNRKRKAKEWIENGRAGQGRSRW